MRRAVRMTAEGLPYQGSFTRADVIAALQSRADYLNCVFGALFRIDADAQDAAAGDPDPDWLDAPLRRIIEEGEDPS